MSAPILQPGDHIHIQVAVSPMLNSAEAVREAGLKAYEELTKMYNQLGVFVPWYSITNSPGAETKIISVVRNATAKDAINV